MQIVDENIHMMDCCYNLVASHDVKDIYYQVIYYQENNSRYLRTLEKNSSHKIGDCIGIELDFDNKAWQKKSGEWQESK